MKRQFLNAEEVPARTEDLEKSLNRFLLNQTFSIEDFKHTYRKLMKAAVMQVFFWPKLQAEFQHATIEHDAFTSIRLGDLLLEAARHLLPLESVLPHVPSGAAFQRTSPIGLVLSSLDLRPEESFCGIPC